MLPAAFVDKKVLLGDATLVPVVPVPHPSVPVPNFLAGLPVNGTGTDTGMQSLLPGSGAQTGSRANGVVQGIRISTDFTWFM